MLLRVREGQVEMEENEKEEKKRASQNIQETKQV